MKFIFILFLCVCGSRTSDAFRILGIFIHPAISHFRAFQPVLQGLAEKGHEVHVISHFPSKNVPKNYHDIVLENVDDVLTGAFSVEEVSNRIFYQA
jgi:glucuronosyltransferase